MPSDRFFVSDIHNPLLNAEELRHLKVMRIRDGEIFELVDGKGHLATGHKIQDKIIIDTIETTPPPHPAIIAQAFPKINRLDVILEKGCELGMTELILFPGENSEKFDLSPNQLKRAETILISAMKQSGRLFLPKLTIAQPLYKWEKPSLPSFFGDTDPSAPFFLDLLSKPLKGALFFVGPEKGFTPEEREILQKMGVKGVKLSPYILRTETAPLAALTLINHFL